MVALGATSVGIGNGSIGMLHQVGMRSIGVLHHVGNGSTGVLHQVGNGSIGSATSGRQCRLVVLH